MGIIISSIIVLVVIVVLVFITINKKGEPATSQVGSVAPQTGGLTGQNNMGNTQQVQGVKITTIKEGTGVAVKSGDTVAMNYTGKLADGTVFDSNIDPKFSYKDASGKEAHYLVPFVFTVGGGQVIKGWDVGIVGMKVGEQRTLEISPDYGYGATGAGGVIPPNATLTFNVELLAIK